MAKSGKVLGALVGLLLVLALLAASSGGLYFAKHETDMLHLIDIVERRAAGEFPHLGFMTPLGIWAFEPFVLLRKAGLDLGAALVWGQIGFALLLMPAAWWAGVSRMPTVQAIALGTLVLLLAAGMVNGGTDTKVTLSMHYNRWAWALAFLPLTLAVLPRQKGPAWADGVVTGLAMAALALMKATYFAGFAPAVAVGYMLRRDWTALGVALGVGVLVFLLVTLQFGIGFWAAYLGDMLTVARSEVRAAPGVTKSELLTGPAFLAGTALGLYTIISLRTKSRGNPLGTIMALFFAGGLYVTWQNYGNDPMWLLLWGLLLLSLPVEAHRWHKAPLTGVVALALIAPVALNIGWSPVRHLLQPRAVFAPLFPGQGERADISAVSVRMSNMLAQVPLYGDAKSCTLQGGAVAWMRGMVDELETAGLAREPVFVADIFNYLWLFGEVPRLSDGAPWYYGGLPGVDEAELLLVPTCPIDNGVRDEVMAAVGARAVSLDSVLETERMQVFRITR